MHFQPPAVTCFHALEITDCSIRFIITISHVHENLLTLSNTCSRIPVIVTVREGDVTVWNPSSAVK